MKPIQEQSQGSRNSYLGWSSDQLQRRPPPAPGGSCEVGEWHYVGEAGEPAFEGDWLAAGDGFTRFRSFCDETEIELSCEGTSASTIFTLPAAFCPTANTYGTVGDGTSNGAQNIEVFTTGEVFAQ